MSDFQLDHVGICVSDLDKAIKWYKDIFGFEEVKRAEKAELEINYAILKLDNFVLEVISPFKPEKFELQGNSLTTELRKIGTNHFSVLVDDIQTVYNTFQNNNVELVTELISNRLFFCKDPDGTLIEIKQLNHLRRKLRIY